MNVLYTEKAEEEYGLLVDKIDLEPLLNDLKTDKIPTKMLTQQEKTDIYTDINFKSFEENYARLFHTEITINEINCSMKIQKNEKLKSSGQKIFKNNETILFKKELKIKKLNIDKIETKS